ncbi:MAG: tetratricopeptide repeat protein [Gammaproteobacteria bacterium]
MSSHIYRYVIILTVIIAAGIAPAWADKSSALVAYENGNYKEAARQFRPLAENGDAEAQYYLGYLYEKGRGVAKDPALMRKWYQRAADGGNAKAQYKVAVGYAFGLAGLPRSDEDAARWLRQSAENGYKRAQKTLGRAYADGRYGLPRDAKQAEYWSKMASSL